MPEPIARQMSPMMSPEEVLASALNPFAQTVRDYGQGQIDLAKLQLHTALKKQEDSIAHQRAMEIVQAKIAGDKDLAQWHERAAQIRADSQEKSWEKRIDESERKSNAREKARLEQLSEAEKQTEIKNYVARISSINGVVPQRANGETSDSFLNKLITAQKEAIDNHNKEQAKVINGFDNQLDAIDKKHAEVATSNANALAPDAFIQRLNQSDPANAMLVQQLRGGQKDSKLNPTGKKMSFHEAIKAVGLDGDYNQYWQAMQDDQLQKRLSTDRNRLQVQGLRGRFATANPDAEVIAMQNRAASTQPATQPPTDPLAEQVRAQAAADAARKATGGQTQIDSSLIPPALQNPATRAIVQDYHPLGTNWVSDAGDVIANTSHAMADSMAKIQGELKDLGVTVDPAGRITVPTTKPAVDIGNAVRQMSGYPAVGTQPMSPAERNTILVKAHKLVTELKELSIKQNALNQSTISPQSAAPAVSPNDPAAVAGSQVLAPGWPTQGAGSIMDDPAAVIRGN